MDPTIEQYSPALRRILALIFVYLGLADHVRDTGDDAARAFRALAEPATVSRRVHRMVRKLLLPVEAATRRLIVALAAALPDPALRRRELKLERPRVAPKFVAAWRVWTPGIMVPRHLFAPPVKPAPKAPVRPPRFALFDPLKRFNRRRCVKRLSVPAIRSGDEPGSRPVQAQLPPTRHDSMPDRHLMRRVAALAFALDDLPKQAGRFARWRARRNRKLTRRSSPFRPGRPPGSPPLRLSGKDKREEHTLLADLHSLAF